jgi:uncharacterized membrane protein YqhA
MIAPTPPAAGRGLRSMLRSLLSVSRLFVSLAVVGILAASVALVVYEVTVIGLAVVDTIAHGTFSPKTAKALAVGLIEAVDIFLIAVVAHIIGLGLFKLFVDPDLPLPAWLKIRDLDDLKSHLASSVIAVLAVLFMREAVAWDGTRNLLQLGTAVALMIVALTIYLVAKKPKD